MKKILIVNATFYQELSDMLLEGVIKKLTEVGFLYEIIEVLGVFEIPATIAFGETSKKYDGYIALGCVIRGETTHYDYVCSESARGLNDLAIKERIAIGYGIVTAENEDQALKRADSLQKDKGGFAALACLRMMEIKEKFSL